MNRPVHTWLVFLGCLALLLGAMGWVTWHTLGLERERQNAAQEAADKERMRLALWRLDFQASTLVIRENARPPEAFRAFHAPEGVFNRDNTEVKKGEVLAPSPLLGAPPDFVMLHFQLDGQGKTTSPQAPSGNARTLALQNYLDQADIQNAESRLEQLRALLARPGNGARLKVPDPNLRQEDRIQQGVSVGRSNWSNGEMLCDWNFTPQLPLRSDASQLGGASPTVELAQKPAAPAVPVVGNDYVGKQGYLQSELTYENTLRKNAVESQKVETLPQQRQMKEKVAPPSKKDMEQAESKAVASSSSAGSSWNLSKKAAGAKDASAAAGSSPGKPLANSSSVTPDSRQKLQRDSDVAMNQSASAPHSPVSPTDSMAGGQENAGSLPAPQKANQGAFADAKPKPTFKPAEPAAKGGTAAPPAGGPAAEPQVALTLPPPQVNAPITIQTQAPAPVTPTASLPPVATAKPLQGFWVEDTLLLTREATLDGSQVLQGVWLDWPKLRDQWLAQVRDLFPEAALVPASNALPDQPVLDDPLRLASLPVRLVTGAFAVTPVPFWTPMRSSLAVAWCCVGLAGIAVGAVLFGTVALSERRAAFVSAVTHELRTPLTTFRLYSEMLASGMVQDEDQKKNYLGTLEAEAGRLSHLVENVLAYARIERGSARAQVESVSIGDVLDRVVPRLQQRAEQAGMEIAVDANEEERKTMLRVDVAALEQIFFNLVDNACKYAAPRAADKTIHVQAATRGPLAMLRVRDHGAGIAPQERRRVFRPFHKSADKAAHSAPGVGLGLALCERLSKALGGKLSLEKSPSGAGASFVLELPRA